MKIYSASRNISLYTEKNVFLSKTTCTLPAPKLKKE